MADRRRTSRRRQIEAAETGGVSQVGPRTRIRPHATQQRRSGRRETGVVRIQARRYVVRLAAVRYKKRRERDLPFERNRGAEGCPVPYVAPTRGPPFRP